MLDIAPSPILTPQMAQQPVMTLLNHFSTALSSWLSDAYGLVQTGVDKTGKNRYPQLYMQNGGIYSTDLYPDQNMKALCFFEYEGASTLDFDDPLNRSGEWTHNLAAVVWLNLPAIDPNRLYDFSDELADDFLTRGLLASPLGYRIVPASIERRNERIFQRYNFPQERQQLLMHPFAGFRIPFTVTQPYVACGLPFVPAASIPPTTVTPPATVGMPVTTSQTYLFSSQRTLTIDHNLGRQVLVEIYNSAGDSIEGDVVYDSLNRITISFSQPLSGTVVLI